jgi:ubiquinone/menaquinone biosynthesis C-methylase UbiE
MTLKNEDVKNYFDKVPKEWDTLYSHENKLVFFFNQLFRKALYERYEFTFQHCGEISGARVLDIGCGTGRYSIEFAKRGAAKVVGLDFAPQMLDFSRQKAKEVGVADKCEFIEGDFLSQNFREQFDIVVAIGFFDYIQDPSIYFKKIASLTRHRFLATFPADSLIMGTQRKIRYALKRCPLYFYTSEQLKKLFQNNFSSYQLIPSASINKGFFGVGIINTNG